MKKELPARKYFCISTKDGKIGDDSKISNDHISIKDYLTCGKIWDKFGMKNTGDYHNHYLKKMYCLWLMFLKSLLTCA